MPPRNLPAARSSAYVDKGYCGHDAPNPRRVFISGQKRGVFGVIKREPRRRSAIDRLPEDRRPLGRCYLKGRDGDAAIAILSAVGHNLRLVPAWLRVILRFFFFVALFGSPSPCPEGSNRLLNGRQTIVIPIVSIRCGQFATVWKKAIRR
jgi:IS5 family transposase